MAEGPLNRSTLEAYGGIFVGIVGVVIPGWQVKAACVLIATGLLVHVAYRSPWTFESRKWVKAFTASIFACLTLFGGGYFAYQTWSEEHRTPKQVSANQRSAFFRKVLFDCTSSSEINEQKIIDAGRIDVLSIGPEDNGFQGIRAMRGVVADRVRYDQTMKDTLPVYFCKIVNFGDKPLAEVDLKFRIFVEGSPKFIVDQSGDTVLVGLPALRKEIWQPIGFQYLDVGSVNARNLIIGLYKDVKETASRHTHETYQIDMPKTATLKFLGGDPEQNVELVPVTGTTLILGPQDFIYQQFLQRRFRAQQQPQGRK